MSRACFPNRRGNQSYRRRLCRPCVEVLEDRLPLGDAALGLLLLPFGLLPGRNTLEGIGSGAGVISPPSTNAMSPESGQQHSLRSAFVQSDPTEVDFAIAAQRAMVPHSAAIEPDPSSLVSRGSSVNFLPMAPGASLNSLLATRVAYQNGVASKEILSATAISTESLTAGTSYLNGREFGHSADNMTSATEAIGRPPIDRWNPIRKDSSLPSPWKDQDIGDVAFAGSATQASNLFTVQGSGADIFGSADAFHFVYQPLSGDGQMVVRVTSVENTDAWAKAGVMIRASLSPDSPHAMMILAPGQGTSFQFRASAGGETSFTNPVPATAPFWVRIMRSGDLFSGCRSSNGHDWTLAGTATIAMSANVYLGLVVTAHNNNLLNTSTFDHVTASIQSPFTWRTAAPSPIPRFEAGNAVADDRLYVFGGFFDFAGHATPRVDVYNPTLDSWTQLSDMPQPITHAGVAVDGEAIYLAGGYDGDWPGQVTNSVLKYDVSTDTWSDMPPLPEARGAGALVRVGRDLHFFGGHDASYQMDKGDHWVLNLDGGTDWTLAAVLPNPRNHFGYAELAGKIYAIGGQHLLNEQSENQSEVDAYDPAMDAWTTVASLPVPRSHSHTSTFTLNGRIITIAGETNGNNAPVTLADVTEYDPATNTWVALPPLPEPRQAAVAQRVGNQIIVTGGALEGIPSATTWVSVLPNNWETSTSMPVALGEVAAGISGHTIYLVGEGNSATLAYDLSTGKWSSAGLAIRPFVGNHHAAEVFSGKLYLLGGLSGSSEGKVQIYDPTLNTWTLGAAMPFAAGSSSSAVINGEIYVAGGIVNSATTDQVAKYNPTNNTWTALAPMPQGRNHTASTTDGTRLFVFGGRTGPNAVANGFDTVQIYDPSTNTWMSSEGNPSITPVPQARGGMGKAVYYNGEFYVLGGETLNGSGATPQEVYDRVDIYNPTTNVWRLVPIMPTARHGIFPLLHAGRIYVAGGGVHSGGSSSAILEIYNADVPDGS